MKIAIIGASGFLGSYLFSYLSSLNKYEVTGTTFSKNKKELVKLDITSYSEINQFLKKNNPDLIIFLSGNKSVSYCEKNPEEAYKINVKPLEYFLQIIKSANISTKLIYISSDYVFDGKKGNYLDSDPVNPKTVYGKTKAEAERMILKSNSNYLIVRTSAVISQKSTFTSFLLTHLKNNQSILMLDNSFFSPTPITFFAEVLEENFSKYSNKIIHVVPQITISRYDFAKKIAKVLSLNESLIISINRLSMVPHVQKNNTLVPSKKIGVDTKDFQNYLVESLQIS